MHESDARVRIAAVGLNFGAHEAKNIKAHPKMELAVVCDLVEEKARALGAELGTPFTTSYEAVLADPRVEAVALFTPPHLHARHLEMAADAGKHVVVTKPLEFSAAAAAAAIERAERAGIVVMSNSPPPRYIGSYGIVKRALDEGRLGSIVQVSGFTWALYDSMQPDGSWYDDPDACPGGPLYRLGIYSINFANAFLGEPAEVYAQQSWIRSKRPTPDHASLLVKYAGGAHLSVSVSLSVGGGVYPDTAVVAGTAGTLIINPTFSSGEGAKDVVLIRGREQTSAASPVGYGAYDYDGLHAFLRRGARPEIGIRTALNGVRIIEAARTSLKEKRAVAL